ncbi:hypothetical protein RclHR1_20300004 [Rhizophagus clarus]|uniref:Uncharacterized protein n=1 Tax=Rhizophagus clarus TaxID=94130 RepID=A0A2Z6R6L2_9GLOM|nr:hypothetical protein RclHR1_20300004 [Rhizophagus clarus]
MLAKFVNIHLHYLGPEYQWYEHRTEILKLIGFGLLFQRPITLRFWNYILRRSRKSLDSIRSPEAGGILRRRSKIHRFPEVKFRRSSASERILYEILKVHGFLSTF